MDSVAKQPTPPKLGSRKLIKLSQERERLIVEKMLQVIAGEKAKLNGMTALLGCIVKRFGEMDFAQSEIEAMDPGRMFIREMEGQWQVRVREDASKPVELSLVPELMPEEFLDKEAMERDGVTEVRIHDA